MQTVLPDQILIDEIYEAAAITERWPVLLERLAKLSGAKAAAFLAFDASGVPGYLTTRSYEAAFANYIAHGLGYENIRPKRALANHLMGFAMDLDVCSEQELDADPIYARFLRPYGFQWTAGTVMPVPTGETLVLDLARSAEAGPFERATMRMLDVYRPHLARAALMSHHLGMRTARDQTAALERIGIPAAAIAAGRVLAANSLFEQLAPRIAIAGFNRLVVADRTVSQLLAAALNASGSVEAITYSIPLKGDEDTTALVLHVLPARRAATDIFVRATAMVVVTPVAMPQAPLRELLLGLFDLTPAEARAAALLGQGRSVNGIARATSSSVETIRTHLKSVMNKTGTVRQAELALLLTGARPVDPTAPEST